jgi:tRNA uridine 5-carbamoylmethylation protein Kti12
LVGQIGRFKIETTDKVFLEMPDRHVGMPEVMRLRRQFIAVNSVNVTEAEHVRDRFLEYLNAQFEE